MTTTTTRLTRTLPCKGRCLGGRRCVCAAGAHEQHICRDPACACHQPAAFGLVRTVAHGGYEVYVEAGEGER